MSNVQSGNGHLLDYEEFAAAIESHLDAVGDITIVNRTGLALTMRVGETEMQFNLENFYDAYQQAPDHLDAIAARAVEAVQSFKLARNIQHFDELRERIFPMLKPITLLVAVRERQLPMLVYRPFLADLIVAYVIDEPSSVAYINEEHLERWEVGVQTIHDQALANLRRRTLENTNYTVAGEGAQQLFIFSSQDGYDASRLLLPEILEQWRKQLPGQMVIGVPNRDFLIAFSDVDRTILANVAQQIQSDAAQRAYGITDQLFTLVNGEVREYEWK